MPPRAHPQQQLAPAHRNEYGETRKELQERINHLQKEAFQLANYYFVFQGVIFTSFFGPPSEIKCRYRWVPLTLSLVAGFLNLCALLNIALKYKSTLGRMDNEAIGIGPGQPQGAPLRAQVWLRMLCVYACMGLFIGFIAVTLVGCWNVCCAHDLYSKP